MTDADARTLAAPHDRFDDDTVALLMTTLGADRDEIGRVPFVLTRVRLSSLGDQVCAATDYRTDGDADGGELVDDLADEYARHPDSVEPVVLAPDPDDAARLWVCDGFHRLAAANEAGLTAVPAYVAAPEPAVASPDSAGPDV